MIQYETGMPFPDKRYLASEGAIIRFNEACFDVIISLNGISPEELKAFSSASLTYGIFVRRQVPFLFLDFGVFDRDCTFNIFSLASEEAKLWLGKQGNLVNLFLVDRISGLLQAIRTISLAQRLMIELRLQLTDQMRLYSSASEVNSEIKKIESEFTTKAMLKRADHYTSV
jgi:hypothetical protein